MSGAYCEAHKFGGTSLHNAAAFVTAANLIPQHQSTVVIVSALSGVTNQLQQALDRACGGHAPQSLLSELYQRHGQLCNDLELSDSEPVIAQLDEWFQAVTAVLTSIKVVGVFSDAERAEVLGLGERCSALILNALINKQRTSRFLDASSILYLQRHHGLEHFDYTRSRTALEGYLASGDAEVIVITGFLARNEQGHTTLLQRNGSDISASVFAELFATERLVIWTDQDGIYTCDPTLVPMAFPVPSMSYAEALELAYFGTTIIHPSAIAPAAQAQRPIVIKNAANPEAPGTVICAEPAKDGHYVRGLTRIQDIALMTIAGSAMMGIAGVSARLFSSLSQEGISVIMISQASSEQSICLCVKKTDGTRALKALQQAFIYELENQLINTIELEDDVAIVAAVGDQMSHHVGIAGRMCSTLAAADVNIRAIAQGASERNISLVVKLTDLSRALRALHSGFYLSAKTIALGIIGVGVVGGELLDQLSTAAQRLYDQDNICFHLRGIMNSKHMLLADKYIPLSRWREVFSQAVSTVDMERWITHLTADDYPHAVVIDCTASQGVADHYLEFIQRGLHVITPNKRANSGDINFYQQLRAAVRDKQRYFMYETTVCAGLPVMTTLQDILRTGDEVLELCGVVSGSLNYIFTQVNAGQSLSSAVKEAKQLGYTEPDPRDDLSGRDVARKMVCLARELGLQVDLDSLPCVNLVPVALRDVSRDEFLEQLSSFDAEFSQQFADLGQADSKVAYVGSINVATGEVRVDMQAFACDHPFAQLNGTDNMLIFKTRRYNEQPLIVRGPGAGAAVTASGVFADLLRLTSSLSA